MSESSTGGVGWLPTTTGARTVAVSLGEPVGVNALALGDVGAPEATAADAPVGLGTVAVDVPAAVVVVEAVEPATGAGAICMSADALFAEASWFPVQPRVSAVATAPRAKVIRWSNIDLLLG